MNKEKIIELGDWKIIELGDWKFVLRGEGYVLERIFYKDEELTANINSVTISLDRNSFIVIETKGTVWK